MLDVVFESAHFNKIFLLRPPLQPHCPSFGVETRFVPSFMFGLIVEDFAFLGHP